MQDRFKFRAWDKENKKYIYGIEKGLEFYSTAGNLRVMTLAEIAESSKYDLEQCAGHRDYKGKLIYINDILNLKRVPNLYQCVFSHTRVGFDFKPLNTEYKWNDFLAINSADDFLNHCVITGNVHENPELLEEHK